MMTVQDYLADYQDDSAFLDSRSGFMKGDARAIQQAIADNLAGVTFKQVLQPDASPEMARIMPQATFNPGIYGDIIPLQIPLIANTSLLALPRPKNTRTLLVIINPGNANLYVNYDQAANIASLPIPAGGNLFFDACVPQNDVYLFYGANLTVPIFAMNVDLAFSHL